MPTTTTPTTDTHTPISLLKANHFSQNMFARVISDTLNEDKTARLCLDKNGMQITQFLAKQIAGDSNHDLGEAQFSILSFPKQNSHIGTVVLNVFTEPTLDLTDTFGGNWALNELSSIQTQDLSQSSQIFFQDFLERLTIESNRYNLFSSLTIVGGDMPYSQVCPELVDGIVLTAMIPYILPSVGCGKFLITMQISPAFSLTVKG